MLPSMGQRSLSASEWTSASDRPSKAAMVAIVIAEYASAMKSKALSRNLPVADLVSGTSTARFKRTYAEGPLRAISYLEPRMDCIVDQTS